jgi:hypothetical protein
MLYNNKLGYILNLIYIKASSGFGNTAETASQARQSRAAILPPLLNTSVAPVIKRVIPALFPGAWMGGWIINDMGLFGSPMTAAGPSWRPGTATGMALPWLILGFCVQPAYEPGNS